MGRHRTQDEKRALGERARALRAEGRSRREIQAELGIGDDLAKALLAGTEVPDALRRPRAKDELRAVAVQMRQAGATYDEIAAELGVPDVTFGKAVIKRHRPQTGRKNIGLDYHGCLSIYVRNGAQLLQRIDGWTIGALLGAGGALPSDEMPWMAG